MAASPPPTAHALLTRHFLRQFLENDLVSPDADRTQLLALLGAMLLSLTLLVSLAMSFNYVMVPLTPGQVAVLSLDDKFFYVALSMIVTALAALAQWDGLALDARDAAILEPLPVRAGTIRRAKLSAVAILGAAVAAAVSAVPSVIFPWLVVYSLRQMRLVAVLGLMATHVVVTIAAAAFGYVAVIALRETLAALLGPRRFVRVSPWVQGALIVIVGASLLLLPAASDRIGQRGLEGWRALSPPMWFLGAYETVAGGLIADLPRGPMRPRQAENDRVGRALYEARRGHFPALARRAGAAIGLAVIGAAAAYLWNARRPLPLAPVAPTACRRRSRLVARLTGALCRDPAARAGFSFTVAVMWRSHPHRLTLACAAAVGLAMALVALSGSTVQPGAGAAPRLLSMQPLLYGALLVGFRHAMRVPAEWRANWGVQLAWRGRERAFLGGAKCAAIVGLVLPVLTVLLPVFAYVLGRVPAMMHAALGLAGAIVLLEALLLEYRKVPFTCTYVPDENMKAIAPISAIAFLVGASLFARMQHDALEGTGAARAFATLAALYLALRVVAMTRPRVRQMEFDEAPAGVQRLGLDG